MIDVIATLWLAVGVVVLLAVMGASRRSLYSCPCSSWEVFTGSAFVILLWPFVFAVYAALGVWRIIDWTRNGKW